MASKDEITVGCKVNIEIADRLRAIASEKGIGVNSVLREIIKESFEGQTMYDEEYQRIADRLEISVFGLIQMMDFLIDSEYVYRNDEGNLVYRKYKLEPDYISVDREVDSLNLTDRQKNRLKEDIIRNLPWYSTSDDTGNGGGL